jgi:hypothetical protein
MDMSKPTAAHHKLEKLVGTWSGEEKMHLSPWGATGGPATGWVENRLALGGWIIIQDYRQEREGKTSFEGHAVFSWDRDHETYVLNWWDSMGMPPHEFRGSWEGDVLTLTSETPQGRSRARFHFGKEGHYDFTMDVSPDGRTWLTFMEGSYTRKV